MIVPSIDLMGGRAVQLVGGRGRPVESEDPFEMAERFAVVGEIAVIDLDAALGCGSNDDIVRQLVRRYRCRFGGGVRTVSEALQWLDAGAEKVILGTAATPEILTELPRDRVIAALDGVEGEVVVRGWTEHTGATVLDRLVELKDLVGGFLVTFVESEGRLGG
ncbi:MAG: HisA/HisF-related TIM barrel protein, partial [Candidatus Sulfomarinibacteraceae bacterium]